MPSGPGAYDSYCDRLLADTRARAVFLLAVVDAKKGGAQRSGYSIAARDRAALSMFPGALRALADENDRTNAVLVAAGATVRALGRYDDLALDVGEELGRCGVVLVVVDGALGSGTSIVGISPDAAVSAMLRDIAASIDRDLRAS